MSDDNASRTQSAPRSREQRKREALARLTADMDLWVATADPAGTPCLVPVSFWWDGAHVWFSTRDTNPTGRNLTPCGPVRLSLGHTRDVVLIEGVAEMVTGGRLPATAAEGFVAKCSWDPRSDHPSYVFFRVTLDVLQAWGTTAEMGGRTLMRDGLWLL